MTGAGAGLCDSWASAFTRLPLQLVTAGEVEVFSEHPPPHRMGCQEVELRPAETPPGMLYPAVGAGSMN